MKNYIAHARMTPEGKLLLDDPSPVFERTTPYEAKGLEDPRIFTLDGRTLITYTAWDGGQARVAFAEAYAVYPGAPQGTRCIFTELKRTNPKP